MSHVRKLFESCRCSPVWLVLGVYRQQIDRVYLQNFLSNKTHKNTISVDLRRIFLEFLPADGKLMASEAKAAGVAWGSCEECHWRRDKWCANGSLAASWSILPQFLHTISSTISSTISINFLEMKKKMKFKRPVKIGWSWCFVYFCSHFVLSPWGMVQGQDGSNDRADEKGHSGMSGFVAKSGNLMFELPQTILQESATESGLKFIEELRKAAKEVVFQVQSSRCWLFFWSSTLVGRLAKTSKYWQNFRANLAGSDT